MSHIVSLERKRLLKCLARVKAKSPEEIIQHPFGSQQRQRPVEMTRFRVCRALAREFSDLAAFGVEDTFSLSVGLKHIVTKEIGRSGLVRVGQNYE